MSFKRKHEIKALIMKFDEEDLNEQSVSQGVTNCRTPKVIAVMPLILIGREIEKV